MAFLAYSGAAFALSLALTALCRVASVRLGYVAAPRHDRWHQQPTALFGGVAIVLSLSAVALTLRPVGAIFVVLGPGLAIATLGLVDDIVSLKPATKLVAQIVVATLLLFLGFRLGWTRSMIFDAMLTLFWIVGISNAFNLLDNMDGLCAGTALVAAGFLLVQLQHEGSVLLARYVAALVGATAGFLVYNVNPASIFMGDTGSLFLGLNLAALTLTDKPESPGKTGLLSVVATPVLLLLVPILDTTLVTTMRLLSGRKPSEGGRDHSSHRLVAIGLSEPRAVATLWMLSAAGGVLSILLQDRGSAVLAVALMFLVAVVIFAVYLAGIRVYDEAESRERSATTVLVTALLHKPRVAEVMLDLCLIPLAYYAAYRLRFEGALFVPNYPLFIQSLPIVLAAQLLSLFVVGGYRGTWRYFGLMDAVVFTKGVVLGTIAAQIALLEIYRFESYSRAVFAIDGAILLLLLAGSRASFRLIGEFVLRRTARGRRCAIYGVGGASLATIREAFGDGVQLKITGFIDDDPQRRNVRIGGYPVLGGHAQLTDLIQRHAVDCVVLNTNIISIDLLQDLQRVCADHDVELLRLHVLVKRLSAAS
jgi:UDP-GlcNAc:undecaprenyl-phosphate/decaprenyl-phosphate GlcNAc-1-phosphate transferase